MNIYEDINSLELNEMIKNKEKFILLDVRTEEEYEASHIPNAIIVLKPSKYVSDMLHIGREKEITILRIVKSINYEYK